jgi:predicted permease
LFGLLPAWRGSRIDPQSGLRSGGRSATEGRQSGRLRSTLVGFEVALSTICLVGAGLLLNSFVRLIHVDRGFAVDRITTVTLNMPVSRYPDAAHRTEFLRKLVDQVKSLPGVSYAAVTNLIPLAGEGNNNIIRAEGNIAPELESPIANRRLISEDYFQTMGIALTRGRFFEEADRPRKVAILSEATARRLWPDQDPIGKRMRMGAAEQPLLEVIGVVADVRSDGLNKAPSLTAYMFNNQRDMALLVRTAMDPASIGGAVRGIIRSLDAEMPVPEFRTMQQIVSKSVGERRFQLTLVLLFSAIALVLASLGIYGVVAYSVAQRKNEMGIRIALGASPANLQGLILRQGLTPVAIGLGVGVAGALVIGRILSGLLFGISFADPLTIGVVAAVLVVVAAAACYFPARRATQTDPLMALRCE